MAVLDKRKPWWIVGSFLSAALVTGLLTRGSNYSGQHPLPVGVRSGEDLREQLRARAELDNAIRRAMFDYCRNYEETWNEMTNGEFPVRLTFQYDEKNFVVYFIWIWDEEVWYGLPYEFRKEKILSQVWDLTFNKVISIVPGLKLVLVMRSFKGHEVARAEFDKIKMK